MNLRKDHSDFFEKNYFKLWVELFLILISIFSLCGDYYFIFFTIQLEFWQKIFYSRTYWQVVIGGIYYQPLYVLVAIRVIVGRAFLLCCVRFYFFLSSTGNVVDSLKNRFLYVLTSSSRRDLLPTSLRIFYFYFSWDETSAVCGTLNPCIYRFFADNRGLLNVYMTWGIPCSHFYQKNLSAYFLTLLRRPEYSCRL